MLCDDEEVGSRTYHVRNTFVLRTKDACIAADVRAYVVRYTPATKPNRAVMLCKPAAFGAVFYSTVSIFRMMPTASVTLGTLLT
jgi:hypothetical protein